MLTVQDLDELERYMYEERASILEYDADMSREDAEQLALHSVMARSERLEMERERYGNRNL